MIAPLIYAFDLAFYDNLFYFLIYNYKLPPIISAGPG